MINGFFPECAVTDEPKRQRGVGLQELGLPYASDPAVTKHLAAFLHRQPETLAERVRGGRSKKKVSGLTAVLFNGGVFKAEPLRQRVVSTLGKWGHNVKVLYDPDVTKSTPTPSGDVVLTKVTGKTSGGAAFDFNFYVANCTANKAMHAGSVGIPPGSGMPHNNLMPYLTISACIAIDWLFPRRD